jgi:hypothetical protein
LASNGDIARTDAAKSPIPISNTRFLVEETEGIESFALSAFEKQEREEPEQKEGEEEEDLAVKKDLWLKV